MEKKPFLSKITSLTLPELLASTMNLLFFALFLFLGSTIILKFTQGSSFFWGVFWISCLGLSFSIIIWFSSVFIGNRIAFFLSKESQLEHVVSANTVIQTFGFSDVESLLHFVRLHNISVYRATRRFSTKYYIDPLFSTFAYVPFMRSLYFSENLLFFDKSQLDAVYSSTIDNLVVSKPELIRSQMSLDIENRCNELQEQLEATKAKLMERNLTEGPFKKKASARLEVIAQLAASSGLRDNLLHEWEEGRNKYSKAYIATRYKSYIEENTDLKKFLTWLTGDNAYVFDDTAMQIFRACMPREMIDWGGKEASSLRKIIEDIKKGDEKK